MREILCKIVGHKFYQREVIDSLFNWGKYEKDYCVRCGHQRFPDV